MRQVSNFSRGMVFFAALCLVVAASGTAGACSIPVFRYALERWHPDYYEAVVMHRGPLGEADQQLVEQMRAASENEEKPANLGVILVDLDDVEKAEDGEGPPKELLEEYADLKSPQLRVHYPPYGPQRWLAWSGPLNRDNVESLVDSPLRQQIIKRILAGDSAVWVMIDSGDEEKDTEAEATIRRGLEEMEKLLELPAQEILESEQEWQPDTQVELRIGFSLLRLKRDDPKEQVFLSMLLNSEPDLADFEEPIAIPIFGRGRTFFALVGKGINAENIQDNCYFICGDCSCQIKEQNPGMDMVMAVNWDEHIMGSAFPDINLPELTGVGGLEIVDLEPLESADTDDQTQESTTSDTANADIQLAQAATQDDIPASHVLAAVETADAESPVREEVPAESTAAVESQESPEPIAASAEATSGFSTRLLVWTLGGAALAAVVILCGSYWMRSSQGV